MGGVALACFFIFSLVLKVFWITCHELTDGKKCPGLPGVIGKEDWKVYRENFFIYEFFKSLKISEDFLVFFANFAVFFTLVELLWIAWICFGKVSKRFLFQVGFLSFAVVSLVVYRFCEVLVISRNCPKDLIENFLPGDSKNPGFILEIQRNIKLSVEVLEFLAFSGFILTVSVMVLVVKQTLLNLIGNLFSLWGLFTALGVILYVFSVLNVKDLPKREDIETLIGTLRLFNPF
jgi:hypothetical protein